jgi:4-hydroxybenzoate polyprenyltransferase
LSACAEIGHDESRTDRAIVVIASPHKVPRTRVLIGHLRIARFDHWLKNVFVLPGVAVAVSIDPAQLEHLAVLPIVAGLLAIGLVSSSNYVLNELLDAPFDSLHPLRRSRPVPSGQVSVPWAWAEWLLLFAAGLAIGAWVGWHYMACLIALWVMGCVYNIPPIRAKDLPFVDVLAEAVNNPIRFLAGWYMTPTAAVPIASMVVSYWMVGCYFMAIKRYAELRDLPSRSVLVGYRKCYSYYTEQNLLISILFYGSLAMLFFGAYMGRYRLEMALAFPLVAAVMAIYLGLAFKPDGAAQHPERLVREPWLMSAVVLCALTILVLLFVDVPALHRLFPSTSRPASIR